MSYSVRWFSVNVPLAERNFFLGTLIPHQNSLELRTNALKNSSFLIFFLGCILVGILSSLMKTKEFDIEENRQTVCEKFSKEKEKKKRIIKGKNKCPEKNEQIRMKTKEKKRQK